MDCVKLLALRAGQAITIRRHFAGTLAVFLACDAGFVERVGILRLCWPALRAGQLRSE
jgi:hypothetical protein